MAIKKAASLNSGLLARKGEASPAPVVTQPPAAEDLVKLTVKVTPDEYQQLLLLGMLSRPKRSNQEMLHEAVVQYLEASQADIPAAVVDSIARRRSQQP